MPSTYESGYYRNTKLWLQCRRDVESAMVAEGWSRHARKFHQVSMRRAVRAYRETA